ncbi:MAG TPA: hypothetical protein VD833_16755 [Vicinamibacterales bacterium]|nr:hypothetical protein [Vicinamibacterales bacterium]
MTCHSGLTTPEGEDVSMGAAWRPSMMAHSARDPYWQAGVRREVMDHPLAQTAIEHECSKCHMPMAHVSSRLLARSQAIFANLPGNVDADPLAVDGVSCALCHQIRDENFGTPASFTGGFLVDTGAPVDRRPVYGPYEVAQGHATVMRSASTFLPTPGTHIQRSELCATCHTLYTHALDANARPIGELPEQVPYQEWLQSDFRETASCQDCHMPPAERPTPIASVLGEPRQAFSRHDFRGANVLMLSMLNRYRDQLAVAALPSELDGAISRTRSFLRERAAEVRIVESRRVGNRIEAEVLVRNLAGHKLPSAYPSRRAWLHATLRDAGGRLVFSSGALQPDAGIAGNDNDMDATRLEPHYSEIRSREQVQIYEAILGAPDGSITTGLLTAVRYLKDNRVPPRGFDKSRVPDDVKVWGDAASDPDFRGGEDRLRYVIDAGDTAGPFVFDVALWYQPIGARWARNLEGYAAREPQRFVRYFDSMTPASAIVLARASAAVR